MELSEIGVIKSKEHQFNKKGIFTVEDLLRFLPRRYYDLRTPQSLANFTKRGVSVITGQVTEVKKYDKCIRASVKDSQSGLYLRVTWFNGIRYRIKQILPLEKTQIICCGILDYDEQWHSYIMHEPFVFSRDIKGYQILYPVYPDIPGMSSKYLMEKMKEALDHTEGADIMSDAAIREFKTISAAELYQLIHHPTSLQDITTAKKRLVLETLYNFARNLEIEDLDFNPTSPYTIHTLQKTNTFLHSLPYTLTDGQQDALNNIVAQIKQGKHVNALVQGDVGCGKTIVAFVSMFCMADNGYQSVLTAPTGVLAEQHYKELKSYAEPLGFKVAYLANQKASEKKQILNGIANGDYDFIVGTHAVFSEGVQYANLGMAICDEEHRFGVLQREHLIKNNVGVHHITMSATPIPRTLAKATMGKNIDVFTIKTLPNGRKPVKTCISNNEPAIFQFMQQQIEQGHQCYIVCPLKEESSGMEAESTEEVYEKIQHYLPNINATVLTGGMDKDQTSEILSDFSANRIQVLIATTIVEVGVNVPNSTVITIWNAERFGLATLHQLRGRVGRGSFQSYCVLKSADVSNERLVAMTQTTDGFEIAKKDLEIRGAGDFIGTRQSGETREVMLMLKYPELFERIQKFVAAEISKETELKF